MDKNQIIGISLLVLIVIGFSIMNKPSEEEMARENRRLDSIEALTQVPDEAVQEPIVQDTSQLAASPQEAGASQQKEESFSLENEDVLLKISNQGAKISFLQLKDYHRGDSSDLVLVEPGRNHFGYTMPSGVNTDVLWFRKISQSERSIVLETTIDGTSVQFSYELAESGYSMNFVSDWKGGQSSKLEWNQQLLLQEHKEENERLKTSVYFKETGEEPDYVSERKDEDDQEIGEDSRVDWISFKQHFFNQTIVPTTGFESAYLSQNFVEGDDYIRDLHASIDLASSNRHEMKFIFAPNHFSTLKDYDIKLERIVNLGWGIFGWLNRFLVIPVFSVLKNVTSNFGLIIFILTLLFKSVLLFFTYKSFLSGAKMRLLKPELDIIKKKNDGDMQAQQAEQMKLYQATGVSPFGGCLPMLVQMPILLALFNFFPNSFELRQQSFLWVTDLSSYDSIYEFGFHIPGYGDHISLFALLMTISTFVYTLINQSYQPPQQKELKYLPYIMPIVFLSFLNSYSAALSYYYFLANIMSIGQTFLFKAFVDEDKLKLQIEEKKKSKAAASGGSGGAGMQGKMQTWMEKQQKKQQAIQQQRNKKKK